MEKTKEYMGDKKFFGYSAKDNNCQDFIVAILRSNSIGSISYVPKNKNISNYAYDHGIIISVFHYDLISLSHLLNKIF